MKTAIGAPIESCTSCEKTAAHEVIGLSDRDGWVVLRCRWCSGVDEYPDDQAVHIRLAFGTGNEVRAEDTGVRFQVTTPEGRFVDVPYPVYAEFPGSHKRTVRA